MYRCINLPGDSYSLAPFADAGALRTFYERFGCDGIELILCGDDFGGKILPGMAQGLHLIFYPEWMALWQQDYAWLDREFDGRENWHSFYAATKPAHLVDIYRRELQVAHRLGARYVVFHVGDNPLEEYFTRRPRRSNREILDLSAELLNAVFDDTPFEGELLLENMWLGGMDLTDPDDTAYILQAVRYQNTGVMLDTGHLMVTNPRLCEGDGEQACAYIQQIVNRHGPLAKKIRGVHLHQSLSGSYFAAAPRTAAHLHGSYIDKYCQTNEHLRQVDPHRPFVAQGVPALVRHIAPEYLVYELSRSDVADWEQKLAAQQAVFENEQR